MITSSNADFNQDGFAAVVRDLERAYLLLAESGIQGGDSPTSTTLSFTTGESNPSNTNLTIQPWEMKNADTNPAFFIKPVGGTILYDNIGNKFSKGSTVPIKYGDTFSIEASGGGGLGTTGLACSVLGRSVNTDGIVASIQASSNDTVLKRASGSLSWGKVNYVDMQSTSSLCLLGGYGSNIYEINCYSWGRIPCSIYPTGIIFTNTPYIGGQGFDGSLTIHDNNWDPVRGSTSFSYGTKLKPMGFETYYYDISSSIPLLNIDTSVVSVTGGWTTSKQVKIRELDAVESGVAKKILVICSVAY